MHVLHLCQMPDILVVLCNGTVGGEEACFCDVDQALLVPCIFVLVVFVYSFFCLDVLFQVEQHARYAYPVGTFILTLIGVSLSSRKVRGGTGLHIGIGIALCFSYILFIRFFEEFAKSGTLPPWIAVWIPNVLYLCIAVYLYRKAPK